MGKSVELSLISIKHSQDSLKQDVEEEEVREVFGEAEGITSNEFSRAGQLGLTATTMVAIFEGDYNKEKKCILDGTRYRIYRTFPRKNSNLIELYLAEEVTS